MVTLHLKNNFKQMKHTPFIIAIASLIFIQCGKKTDPFAISNGTIGNLTKQTQIKDIDSIFSKDSIIKLNSIQTELGTQGEVEIYEPASISGNKGGKKLLLLSPAKENDPNSLINNIQIFDPRYKTQKGIGINSTFKDVKDNYTIKSIESTIKSVVVILKDSDIYITIDKKELPEDLRYNPSIKIDETQIPNEAKIKYFMIGWDAE